MKNRQPQAPDDYLVLPENWKAIELLRACSTQWRYTAIGHRTGLHYGGVDIVLQRGGFEPFSPDDWHNFQIAERVAISEFNQ